MSTSIPDISSAQEQKNVQVLKNVSYLNPDRKEKLDLYLPPKNNENKNEQRPAILIIHGGGWHGGDKAAGREKNIGTNLAKAGFVCSQCELCSRRQKGPVH